MLTLEQIRNLKIGDTVYYLTDESKVIECIIDQLSFEKVCYSTNQGWDCSFLITNYNRGNNKKLFLNNPFENMDTIVDQFIVQRPDYISDNVITRLKNLPLCCFPIKITALSRGKDQK